MNSGGGKTNGYKNTGMKKVILGKERCIYKIAKDRKEYVKYKGELVTVKYFKEALRPIMKKTVGGEPSDDILLLDAMSRYNDVGYDGSTDRRLSDLNRTFVSGEPFTITQIQNSIDNIIDDIGNNIKKLQILKRYFEYIHNKYDGDSQQCKDDVVMIKDHIDELIRRSNNRRKLTINDRIKRFRDMDYREEARDMVGDTPDIIGKQILENYYSSQCRRKIKRDANVFLCIAAFEKAFQNALMKLYNGEYSIITTYNNKDEIGELKDFFRFLKCDEDFPKIIKGDIAAIKGYIDKIIESTDKNKVYKITYRDYDKTLKTINGITIKAVDEKKRRVKFSEIIKYDYLQNDKINLYKLTFEKDGEEHYILYYVNNPIALHKSEYFYDGEGKENKITDLVIEPMK
jgi:hypothetical protein